jgi:hypothetical protein
LAATACVVGAALSFSVFSATGFSGAGGGSISVLSMDLESVAESEGVAWVGSILVS